MALASDSVLRNSSAAGLIPPAAAAAPDPTRGIGTESSSPGWAWPVTAHAPTIHRTEPTSARVASAWECDGDP
eukprot:3933382-Rhodomonas_salina.2